MAGIHVPVNDLSGKLPIQAAKTFDIFRSKTLRQEHACFFPQIYIHFFNFSLNSRECPGQNLSIKIAFLAARTVQPRQNSMQPPYQRAKGIISAALHIFPGLFPELFSAHPLSLNPPAQNSKQFSFLRQIFPAVLHYIFRLSSI
ncbi:MAG TPA: hypothetical protein H9744_02895 [Candidatus Eisenbergiella stercoravium]|nr:hypothetical protein [Candidatus Eisenbergiella stercoravium]